MSEEQIPEPALTDPPSPPGESFPFWSYQDLAVLIGLALPSLLAGALLVEGLVRTFTTTAPGRPVQLLVAQFLGYGLWFICLYTVLRLRYDRPFWRSLGWTMPSRAVLVSSLAWGPVLAIVASVLGILMRTPNLDMPIKQFLSDRESIFLMGLFASTLGPVCEELIFRGFVLPLLVRSLGVMTGVVATALPFALLHGPQYSWSWRHILLVTLAGSAFGWVRLRTGSTIAAATLHGSYNLTFFIAFLTTGKG
jgi:uncharacterized protein